MNMDVISVSLREVLEAIEDARLKTKLTDKPFILGLLTEQKAGKLSKLLNDNKDIFTKIGVQRIEWRDDAYRTHIRVANEDLIFSVHGV